MPEEAAVLKAVHSVQNSDRLLGGHQAYPWSAILLSLAPQSWKQYAGTMQLTLLLRVGVALRNERIPLRRNELQVTNFASIENQPAAYQLLQYLLYFSRIPNKLIIFEF